VPSDYIRKQTLSSCERYITPELKEFEAQIADAESQIAAVEDAIYARVLAELATELEGEQVIRGPEKGNYRGATAPGYPVVKNNGVLALTRRQLVFQTLTGKAIEIPVDTITGVRDASAFKGSVVGGRTHLIIATAAGEIGFYVPDNAGWTAALRQCLPSS